MSIINEHLNGIYRVFACSTGLWSIAYARYHFPDHLIHVSGISLRSGGHFHGNQTGDFQDLSARKDSFLLRRLRCRNLSSTDERFCSVSGATLIGSDLIHFPSS
jgi:hypothetical protein